MLACVVNKAGDSVCSAVVNFNSPSVKSSISFDVLSWVWDPSSVCFIWSATFFCCFFFEPEVNLFSKVLSPKKLEKTLPVAFNDCLGFKPIWVTAPRKPAPPKPNSGSAIPVS